MEMSPALKRLVWSPARAEARHRAAGIEREAQRLERRSERLERSAAALRDAAGLLYREATEIEDAID